MDRLGQAFQQGFQKEARNYLPLSLAGLTGLAAGGSAGYAMGESAGRQNERESLPQAARAADQVLSLSELDDSEIREIGMDPQRVREDASRLEELMGTENYGH